MNSSSKSPKKAISMTLPPIRQRASNAAPNSPTTANMKGLFQRLEAIDKQIEDQKIQIERLQKELNSDLYKLVQAKNLANKEIVRRKELVKKTRDTCVAEIKKIQEDMLAALKHKQESCDQIIGKINAEQVPQLANVERGTQDYKSKQASVQSAIQKAKEQVSQMKAEKQRIMDSLEKMQVITIQSPKPPSPKPSSPKPPARKKGFLDMFRKS